MLAKARGASAQYVLRGVTSPEQGLIRGAGKNRSTLCYSTLLEVKLLNLEPKKLGFLPFSPQEPAAEGRPVVWQEAKLVATIVSMSDSVQEVKAGP